MTSAHFAFGKRGLRLPLPDGPEYTLVAGRTAAPLVDVDQALARALDHPGAGPPLLQMAAGKSSAAIAVCDITRPAPNAVTLPPLLERLERAGIARDQITILIATGLHRGPTTEEIGTILGQEIAARYCVLAHDARNREQHRWLGFTGRGTPVYIDERFMAADLHMTLGFIEQHLMLGFSGGRKLVAPGLGGEQTIKAIHAPRFMREPRAVEGSIAENPLHAELLEVAAMARHDFMLDVTLTPERHISGIFAGEPVAAHRAGVRFLEESSLVPLPRAADLVVTSAAGFPLDLTFYQAIKGITAASHLVRPGGSILVLAECAEGVGSPEFSDKLASFRGPAAYLDEIKDKPVVVDQWQLEKLALVAGAAHLFFYTPGVTPGQLGALGAHWYPGPEQALEAALASVQAHPQVALVPEGPYVYARVKE